MTPPSWPTSTGADPPVDAGASLTRPAMPELGNEAGLGEQSHCPEVGQVDDDGIIGVTPAQKGDHAVVAGRSVLHDAVVAIDHQWIGYRWWSGGREQRHGTPRGSIGRDTTDPTKGV